MSTADNRHPPRRPSGTRRVIVLGDTDTGDSADLLRDQAGQQGAVIAETHAFERGEAIAHQNLAEIDTVVAALSRAITIPADIWVPFPVEDLGLEQHVRRLDLALKSHGRALLLGNRLVPCPPDGHSAIDRALRTEVHAVNDLYHAALAATAVQTLYAEIQQVISTSAAVIPEDDTDSSTWLPRLEAEHGPARVSRHRQRRGIGGAPA